MLSDTVEKNMETGFLLPRSFPCFLVSYSGADVYLGQHTNKPNKLGKSYDIAKGSDRHKLGDLLPEPNPTFTNSSSRDTRGPPDIKSCEHSQKADQDTKRILAFQKQ